MTSLSISVTFADGMYAKLSELAKHFKRTEDDLINKALVQYLEDLEDIKDAEEAIARYEASGRRGVPIEEVMAKNGIPY